MKKILIIEDDFVISNEIAKHLNSWGFDAICVCDFNNVYEFIKTVSPHLILLDIHLPQQNGFAICAEIRKFSNTPIVFMSSASDNMNIVMAMNMGGDDFVAKPFDLNVLTAKINALVRRSYEFNVETFALQIDGLSLDKESAKASFNGKIAELTKNEFLILKTLMENKGKIISRDNLMTALWNSESFIDDNTLTVNVTRLRKKLSEIGINNLIETKKNMGYVINGLH